MTFLEKLWAHRGGLVRLSTQLYWYDRRGRDGTPGRLCLLLDAVPITAAAFDAAPAARTVARTAGAFDAAAAGAFAVAHLLIDGQPGWVRATEKDVEII